MAGQHPWFLVWMLVLAANTLMLRGLLATASAMWGHASKDERLGMLLIGFGHVIATSLLVFLGFILARASDV